MIDVKTKVITTLFMIFIVFIIINNPSKHTEPVVVKDTINNNVIIRSFNYSSLDDFIVIDSVNKQFKLK